MSTPAVSQLQTTGHAWARTSDAACVLRKSDRTGNMTWHGLLAHNGWRMPSGRVSHESLLKQRNTPQDILTRATAEILDTGLKAAKRIMSLAILEINPADELYFAGGRISNREADLVFASDADVVINDRMASTVVTVLGGVILMRALANGRVELIPFSLNTQKPAHEIRRQRDLIPVSFFSLCPSHGFADHYTGVPLIDLSAMDLYGLATRSSTHATLQRFREALFGPINDALGHPFEMTVLSETPQIATPDFIMDTAISANQIGANLAWLIWTPPTTSLGSPRLLLASTKDAFTFSVAAALFSALSDPVPPLLLPEAATTEPPSPWNPRSAPRFRVDVPTQVSSHDILASHEKAANTWNARRTNPSEEWRFRQNNGSRIPSDVISAIDQHFAGMR